MLPNYLCDYTPRRLLNDAEARLTEEQQDAFCDRLERDLIDAGRHRRTFKMISSSARQRCLAILQVVKPELFK